MRIPITASGAVPNGVTDAKVLRARIQLSWRLIQLSLCIAATALCVGCADPGARAAEAVPAHLAGAWELKLNRKAPISATSTGGKVILRSSPAPASDCARMEDSTPCLTAARGTHTLRTGELMGYALSAEADASLIAPDSVLFMIGDCCDQGEISGRGRWKTDRFEGWWMNQRLGGDPVRGTFTLRRVVDPGSPPHP